MPYRADGQIEACYLRSWNGFRRLWVDSNDRLACAFPGVDPMEFQFDPGILQYRVLLHVIRSGTPGLCVGPGEFHTCFSWFGGDDLHFDSVGIFVWCEPRD